MFATIGVANVGAKDDGVVGAAVGVSVVTITIGFDVTTFVAVSVAFFVFRHSSQSSDSFAANSRKVLVKLPLATASFKPSVAVVYIVVFSSCSSQLPMHCSSRIT